MGLLISFHKTTPSASPSIANPDPIHLAQVKSITNICNANTYAQQVPPGFHDFHTALPAIVYAMD